MKGLIRKQIKPNPTLYWHLADTPLLVVAAIEHKTLQTKQKQILFMNTDTESNEK